MCRYPVSSYSYTRENFCYNFLPLQFVMQRVLFHFTGRSLATITFSLLLISGISGLLRDITGS